MSEAVKTISEHASFGGTQGYYEHMSQECAGPMRFSVFVPKRAGTAAVPVLYYLAGLTCTEDTFTVRFLGRICGREIVKS
jgi:S-formylglutathione hydrolase